MLLDRLALGQAAFVRETPSRRQAPHRVYRARSPPGCRRAIAVCSRSSEVSAQPPRLNQRTGSSRPPMPASQTVYAHSRAPRTNRRRSETEIQSRPVFRFPGIARPLPTRAPMIASSASVISSPSMRKRSFRSNKCGDVKRPHRPEACSATSLSWPRSSPCRSSRRSQRRKRQSGRDRAQAPRRCVCTRSSPGPAPNFGYGTRQMLIAAPPRMFARQMALIRSQRPASSSVAIMGLELTSIT
jgi:hypothetical protein